MTSRAGHQARNSGLAAVKRRDQPLEIGVADVFGAFGAKTAKRHARQFLPIDQQPAVAGIGEDEVHDVARIAMQRAIVAEHGDGRAVPGEHVPAPPHHISGLVAGWPACGAARRRPARDCRARVRRLAPGEDEEMALLGGVELQRFAERDEHLVRRPDVAALLQPSVPGRPDAGDHRDFFAPQPGRAATRAPPAGRHRPDRGVRGASAGRRRVRVGGCLRGRAVDAGHGSHDSSIDTRIK